MPSSGGAVPVEIWHLFLEAIMVTITVIFNVTELLMIVVVPPLRLFKATRFVASLNFADLLVGGFVMMSAFLQDVQQYMETSVLKYHGKVCDAWSVISVAITSASALSICVVAMDRYLCIYKPLHYPRVMVSVTVNVIIIAVWAISATMAAVPFAHESTIKQVHNRTALFLYVNDGSCRTTTYKDLVYICVTVIFIPAIIILFVYTRIFLISRKRIINTLRQHNFDRNMVEWKMWSGIEATPTTTGTSMGRGSFARSSGPPEMGEQKKRSSETFPMESASQRGLSSIPETRKSGVVVFDYEYERESHETPPNSCLLCSLVCCQCLVTRKDESPMFNGYLQACRQMLSALLIVSVIVMSFLVLWLPYGLIITVDTHLDSVSAGWRKLALWLCYSSSALNPILYFLMNSAYRRTIKNHFHHPAPLKEGDQTPIDFLAMPNEHQLPSIPVTAMVAFHASPGSTVDESFGQQLPSEQSLDTAI